jgi:protein-tyrosine phosphatase
MTAQRKRPAEIPPAFQDAHNFRDLGGLRARDGRSVRHGRLFRSGHWGKLEDRDLAFVAGLGIARVIDFRIAHEVETLPDRVPEGVRRDHLPIEGGGMPISEISAALMAGHPERIDPDYLVKANRGYVRAHTKELRQFVHALLESEGRPLAFHCTAGKDRTGMAAALVLSALDVPREAILEDYLRSNAMRTEVRATMMREFTAIATARVGAEHAHRLDLRSVENLLVVKRDYLQAAWDAIDADYGGTDAYLAQGLGLTRADRDALRATYLD